MATRMATDSRPLQQRDLVRLIVADSQAIFRVGVRKVFAMEDDVRLIGQAETLDETLMTVVKFPADVLLIESRLVPNPAEGLIARPESRSRSQSNCHYRVAGRIDDRRLPAARA